MLSRENPLANHPRYAYVRTLGRGAFGTVVEAVDLQVCTDGASLHLPRRATRHHAGWHMRGDKAHAA